MTTFKNLFALLLSSFFSLQAQAALSLPVADACAASDRAVVNQPLYDKEEEKKTEEEEEPDCE